MLTPKSLSRIRNQWSSLAVAGRTRCNWRHVVSLTFSRSKHVLKRRNADKHKANLSEAEPQPIVRRKSRQKAGVQDVDSSSSPGSISRTDGPLDLKLTELQDLARTLGISQTAPKAALVARLRDALANHAAPPPNARILSIDLGIRNLAYALLSPPPQNAQPTAKPRLGGNRQMSEPKPVVHAWNRVDLRSLSTAGPDASQDFSPPSLSLLALDLVRALLLPLDPTHVLIEKQRFRSAGGSAVLEWTVRVNSLESMLYAVFATLKALGHFRGVVIPVDPRRVGPFLLELEGGGNGAEGVVAEIKREKKRVASSDAVRVVKGGKENKKLKIGLVGGWLRDGKGVDFDGGAAVMKHAFLKRWLPKVKRSKADKGAEAEDERVVEKLDDVADCLLQGVAWLKWEENRRQLVKELGGKL